MKRLAALFLTTLLGGCGSTQTVTEPQGVSKPTVETAIAEAIISTVRQGLREREGAERALFLREKLDQFRAGVDTRFINSRMRLESELLQYLAQSENARQGFGNINNFSNFDARIIHLTSLNQPAESYEQPVTEEINRIDRAIAMLAGAGPGNNFHPPRHMDEVRRNATYPDDSIEGRQQYLDDLSQAMIEAQADWHSVLKTYEPSGLRITGVEATDHTFLYDNNGLTINLDSVRDLPAFEIKCIAVYYGYPGLQSLLPMDHGNSLRAELEIPAYHLGWAGYILDYIGEQDEGRRLDYLYCARLTAALALADLRINTGLWNPEQAADYIYETTPYARHRVRLMLNQVINNPGYFLAGVIGKFKFATLQRQCLASRGNCAAEWRQRIVNLGPMPFEMLEARLVINRGGEALP